MDLCKLEPIKNLIAVYFNKCSENRAADSISNSYCKLFIDRSLEFLVQILIIIAKDDPEMDNRFYYADVWSLLVNLLEFNVKSFLSKTSYDGKSFDFIKIILRKKLFNLMKATQIRILKQMG